MHIRIIMMFYDFQYMQSARNKNQLILIGCIFASSRNQKGKGFAGARGKGWEADDRRASRMIAPGGGTGIEISKSSTYLIGNIYQVEKQQTGRVVEVVIVEGRKSVL